MESFPVEGDEIPKGYDGWMIFYDEANSADKAVQKAWYKLSLDRMVGNRKLHERVVQIAAGNLATDNAIVEEMSTALQSRLIHYELMVDNEAWLEWAMTNGIHHYITDFIKFRPDLLYSFKPDHQDVTYSCPRTWDFASRFMHQRGHDLNDHILRVNLAGTVSEGIAREFLGFCKVYGQLPSRESIIKNPATATLPEERSVLWAMTGTVASWANEHVIAPLIEYVKRMPMEFQVICLREINRRNPALVESPPVIDWLAQNATKLY